MKQVYWSAISKKIRTEALTEINEVIHRHATILNFQRFSDLSLGLVLEVESGHLMPLKGDLAHILILDIKEEELPAFNTGLCLLMLNISFPEGSGDLQIEVPAVPG